MCKYYAFKGAPNSNRNVLVIWAPTATVMENFLLSKRLPTAIVIYKYYAFKGAPNSNCNVKFFAFKEAPNSYCNL